MTGRLVHTGQVVLDLVMRVPSLPPTGGDVLAESADLLPGGGFNVMSAAARSGARVVYAGAHGTGRFADQAREALRAEGIELAQPQQQDADNGICVALVEPGGERTFVTGVGAEGRLLPEQLARVRTEPDDVVYVSGYSLLHASNREALLDWLPGVPSRVMLDPCPLVADIPAEVLDAVMPLVDVLSCNAAEARVLTGSADPETAARELGPAAVVVRDGANGCVLSTEGETRRVPGFPATPVDTNGAGDTHCGVLAASLLEGTGPAEAARRANAAAALSVQERGPATAPPRARLEEFLAR
ncbi:PfkB family carbohydrate kinase [Saccharopolyspora flava]|uniref:Sugar or nucleoside kinase, ribokinase family n=1 Tax=Saccharopolyspora flava TaxID=95161 RepID=A0A1I6U4J2_9PSEU|nr:PfkB family carbohydrate kinase [Saccharopolyspora flava]SFS96342.1 Sugar or nucleoside kinase, ribokinase family [Saccharopolyspora flava]